MRRGTDEERAMPVHLRSSHPDATGLLGGALARTVGPGDVIVLTGPLGAGKTRLVQGLAVGLGVSARVTSPTFVLVRRHEGRIPLVHVDAYRLEDARDLVTLDDDVLADDVLTCIEWGGRVADALPSGHLECALTIDGDDGDAPRVLTLTAHGADRVEREQRITDEVRALIDSDAVTGSDARSAALVITAVDAA
jgi:tRNA threonylcarbamoyladenosine biosynthesis protein TsaE